MARVRTEERIAEELAAHGLRATRQRVAVLRQLRKSNAHPTAAAAHRSLVAEHQALTSSKFAEGLLRDWDRELPKFWQIVPKDLIAIGALPAPTKREAARASA